MMQSSRAEAYIRDAHRTVVEQEARGARVLLWLSLITIIGLIAWASVSPIDEVVRGDGSVVPSRRVQVIQSLDGGIVEELLVREGQLVSIDEVLIRIDPTRYSSSLGENRAEYLALTAKAARLEALANDAIFVGPEEVMAENPELVEMERRVWETRNQEVNAAIKQADDQLRQRHQELAETEANHEQAAAGCGLTSQELRVTQPLLKSGAVSEVDILRLRRDVSRYCGEAKAAKAQIERIKVAIEEAESKLVEARLSMRNQARVELSDVRSRLSTLSEERVGLADRVKLASIRSPVNGTIKALNANTIGGVVQPGEDILEIVPMDDTLLLEVRINPRDIGFLRPEQPAEVKFTAYDFTIYGGLQGEVEQISADSIKDEQGNTYYIARVRTEKAFVGDDMPIIPGMMAEVHILTGKRTVMQFLLKPVLRAKSNAFTER